MGIQYSVQLMYDGIEPMRFVLFVTAAPGGAAVLVLVYYFGDPGELTEECGRFIAQIDEHIPIVLGMMVVADEDG